MGLAIALSALSSTACFGIAVFGERVSDADLLRDRNRATQTAPALKTREEARELWGHPSSTSAEGPTEVWYYRREVAISGVVVMVLVPIPLVAPVGFRESELTFADGELVRVRVEDGALLWSAGCFPADDVAWKCAIDD